MAKSKLPRPLPEREKVSGRFLGITAGKGVRMNFLTSSAGSVALEHGMMTVGHSTGRKNHPDTFSFKAIAFGKAIRSDRPVIFEIPEDDAKRKASEALNKRQEDPDDEPGEASGCLNDPAIGPGDGSRID